MARHTRAAVRELLGAVVELAEIVRELNPGKVATYERVEQKLADVRSHLTRGDAFEV